MSPLLLWALFSEALFCIGGLRDTPSVIMPSPPEDCSLPVSSSSILRHAKRTVEKVPGAIGEMRHVRRREQ